MTLKIWEFAQRMDQKWKFLISTGHGSQGSVRRYQVWTSLALPVVIQG